MTHWKMKRAQRWLSVALAVGLGLSQGGCLWMMLEERTRSKDRQAFAQINLDREKAGLRPLRWEDYRR